MAGGKPYYLTTPIYYVNDAPHLGHAYTTVACDALARFMRLDGRRVKFLTGTDEHGQKVEKSAQAAGIDPQAFCDRVSQNFRDMTRLMNISNDDFIRTTEPRHVRGVQALWQELQRRGEIYLGRFAGWYAVRDEAFYDEGELVAGRAPTGAEVEWVEEENYFFRLSAWQERLLKFYDENPDFIAPRARRNEVVSFVKGGLRDLSISRTSFTWGIPVPGDPRHVVYVWLDALANYITALGYPETKSGDYSIFWPADLHMVGKDIIRFHCVYWPAFLMGAGLAPPNRVFAHGWWTVEGQKMSTSRRSISSRSTGSIRCAISCCANCPSAATATSRTARWSTASTAISPMVSAIWRNACCRSSTAIARRACPSRARSLPPMRRCSMPRVDCSTACAAISPSRRSTVRSRRCGKSSAMPTATSTSRRPGRCARVIPSGWRRFFMCWLK